jgi:hypothetical protein
VNISLEKPERYARPKGENRNPRRHPLYPKASLGIAAALLAPVLILCGARSARAQEGAQELAGAPVPAPLITFAAYHPDLNAFPFAQSDEIQTQQPAQQPAQEPAQQPAQSSQAPASQHSELPDDPSAPSAKKHEAQTSAADCPNPPCKSKPPIVDWYMRFVTGPTPKVLTPRDKAYIAARSIIDPFNVITILGEAAISVAADSHSAYGPGFPGFGRYVGVSFTEDLTGEFFNTFLIPSLTHQDPRYHRMPQATIPHRIFHAIYQVAWTQSDYGKGMLNYGNLLGFAIDDEIGNLYVPGRRTNASATAQRYVIGLATAPIDNFISEFLPDVAKHVHVQIVVVQRIINHIAGNDNSAL